MRARSPPRQGWRVRRSMGTPRPRSPELPRPNPVQRVTGPSHAPRSPSPPPADRQAPASQSAPRAPAPFSHPAPAPPSAPRPCHLPCFSFPAARRGRAPSPSHLPPPPPMMRALIPHRRDHNRPGRVDICACVLPGRRPPTSHHAPRPVPELLSSDADAPNPHARRDRSKQRAWRAHRRGDSLMPFSPGLQTSADPGPAPFNRGLFCREHDAPAPIESPLCEP